jgi:hypothetical protein
MADETQAPTVAELVAVVEAAAPATRPRPAGKKPRRPAAKKPKKRVRKSKYRPDGTLKIHGLPTLLTPALQKVILDLLRKGNYRKTAAAAAGITYQTFLNWIHRADEPFASFAQGVFQAEAEGEVALLRRVQRAARTDVANARWLLERKYPEHWARKERVELSGINGGAVEVDVADSRARLVSKLAGLAAAARAGADPRELDAGGAEPAGALLGVLGPAEPEAAPR